jgi:hypothetical protein
MNPRNANAVGAIDIDDADEEATRRAKDKKKRELADLQQTSSDSSLGKSNAPPAVLDVAELKRITAERLKRQKEEATGRHVARSGDMQDTHK